MSNVENCIAPPFSLYVSVLLDQGIDHPLDYGYKEAKPIIGMRVLVPVQNRLCRGTIVEVKETSLVKNVQGVREILSEESLLSSELFTLAKWISSYYCTPLRKVVQIIIPGSIRKETKEKKQLFITRKFSLEKTAEICKALRSTNPMQANILDALLVHPKGLLVTELLEIAKTSKAPLNTLIKKDILESSFIQIDRSILENVEFFPTKAKILTDEQENALNKIKKDLDNHCFQTHLIHGITGSGKTEVYLQAIAYALDKNLGVILLVPEIALTTQTIERLKARFKEKMGILHHRLSAGERFDMWNGIHRGEISIVIGARSAIFSPVKNLGLIIVDEEHENSYKQMDGEPCYHARDVAIMRGKIANATVVLGSATPSIESYYNAMQGKYLLSTINKRAQKAELPKVTIVDMKEEYKKSGGFTLFSEELIKGIKSRYQLGEQTLLFLNRRGYHSFQMCNECGKSIKCPHCDVTLTFHRKWNAISCHLCSHSISPPPRVCPYCKHSDSLKYKGVGTEQVERAVHALFPDIRTLRIDADTTRHKGSHDQLFKQFKSGKADLLIGTQMIAKGLHFPSVTLVGVLNSDGALNIPDFRASESVFQLLTQVSGRSGRGELRGEVIIQSCMKDHPILSFASKEDYLGFYHDELSVRELFDYPPFSRFAKLTFSGPDEAKTLAIAENFHSKLLEALPSSFILYPVIPSGYAKIKDKYRFKLLVKGKNIAALSSLLSTIREKSRLPSSIHLLVDINPLSTFF